MPTSVELPITLAYAQGACSTAALGSRRQRANLVLDSGSSTLAVLPQACDPDQHAALAITALAQQVSIGAGAWRWARLPAGC